MKFNKNQLQNDQLLHDLHREAWADDVIKALRRRKILTYSELFTFLGDNTKDPQLRADICEEISRLFVWIDRRRFVSPLLKALKTDYEPLLKNAIQAIGNLKSKRALPFIMNLVQDKTLSAETRYFAIIALCEGIRDPKAIPALRQVMFDQSDNLRVREDAIEHTAWFSEESLVANYIKLLSDPEPDMRFWAAYGLGIMRTDIAPALNALDRVAAFDHIAPDGWWHIDREALDPLENIHWQLLDLSDGEISRKRVRIISPAPEYTTFEWQFNCWPPQEYKELVPPTLKIDAEWFKEKLREGWSSIKLDVRHPRPQTYLTDWLVEIDNEPLIGGIHRDQYTVVLTGSLKAINVFAAWYRGIIEPEQYLFLYEWAGLAVELRPGMSVEDIEMEARERSKYTNAIDERAVHYPWIIENE